MQTILTLALSHTNTHTRKHTHTHTLSHYRCHIYIYTAFRGGWTGRQNCRRNL